MTRRSVDRVFSSLPCCSITNEMWCAWMHLLREADAAVMVQTVHGTARHGTVQVLFDRSWATLNVFVCAVLYISLALNCWHVFESTWPKSLFPGAGGPEKTKTYNKKQNYQSTPFPMFDCRFWGLQMKVVGLYLRCVLLHQLTCAGVLLAWCLAIVLEGSCEHFEMNVKRWHVNCEWGGGLSPSRE